MFYYKDIKISKFHKMLENLQTDYKQLYSIFLHGLISNKGGYEVVVYKNYHRRAVPKSSPARRGDWGQDVVY